METSQVLSFYIENNPPAPTHGLSASKEVFGYTTLKYEQPIKNKYLKKSIYSLHQTKTKQTGGERKQLGGNRAYAGRGNFEKTITDILRELADNTEP